MKKIAFLLFFSLVLAVANGSAQTDLCFKNEGLKEFHFVSFTVTGNKIEGTFETSNGQPDTSSETFEFTGTKTGNLLTVKFRGTIPYERPPGAKKIVWTLSKTSLKIPRFGKNYQTNKFAAYTAAYEPCGEI